jgi:hypothetical protein
MHNKTTKRGMVYFVNIDAFKRHHTAREIDVCAVRHRAHIMRMRTD